MRIAESLYPRQVIYKNRIFHFTALNWATKRRLFKLMISPDELHSMVQRGDALYQINVRTGIMLRRKYDNKVIKMWFFT